MNIGTQEGKTHKVIVEGDKRVPLFGLSVGQEFEGNILEIDELEDYTLKITGASDDSGTPLRQDLKGSGFRRLLLRGGVGFRPNRRGERRKKRVRGAEIQDDIAQLNLKVTKAGSNPLSE
jgi:small subunit ribosomal protein S6e